MWSFWGVNRPPFVPRNVRISDCIRRVSGAPSVGFLARTFRLAQSATDSTVLGGISRLSAILCGYLCDQTWKQLGAATFLGRNFYGALRVDEVVDKGNRIRRLS